jgi:hypothetical protein
MTGGPAMVASAGIPALPELLGLQAITYSAGRESGQNPGLGVEAICEPVVNARRLAYNGVN